MTTATKNPFVGLWRIIHMDGLEQATVEIEGGAVFEIEDDGSGVFKFGTVRGAMDYRVSTRDSQVIIEWSWGGTDVKDVASGRGWAVLQEGKMRGMIYCHQRVEFGFVAKKVNR